MTQLRLAAAIAALIIFDSVLPAGVTYTIDNRRLFPAADGTVVDSNSNPFTAATADSITTNYTDPLTGNQFNATAGITGSPFHMSVSNSVTFVQPTTSSCCGLLTFSASNINETGVTVTGGIGIGYLLPTFHVYGTFNNAAGFQMDVDTCAGNNACILTGPASTTSAGVQNIDTLFTPAIGSNTQFTYGTPFTFFFFLQAAIGYTTSQVNPSPTITDNFQMDLVGYKLVDAAGNPISGDVNSQFLETAAPEPGTILLCALGLVAAGIRARSKRLV
jgi:hypothetical protein